MIQATVRGSGSVCISRPACLPRGVCAMLHAMTPGALLTRSRLCTVSCGTICARSASPQPKSATTAALLWRWRKLAAACIGCRGHLAVCCLKPCKRDAPACCLVACKVTACCRSTWAQIDLEEINAAVLNAVEGGAAMHLER